jgi:hypothetical protein
MIAVLLVILCLGHTVSTSENTLSPPTITIEGNPNITKYLQHGHRASLNYACQIDRISVTPNFDSFAVGFENPLTQVELEDHLGEPSNIEWAHVMQKFFSSTDPRGQERQMGTLGGDLGEFLIVLAAIEKHAGIKFNETEVTHKLKIYLTVMSRDKFYYDTDISAINFFKSVCNCPQLNIADPPESKKVLLLNATRQPDSQGNEFFKKVLASPQAYEIRLELAEAVIQSFFKVMWNKADPLHRRMKFVLLKGDLNPKGFIMVKTPGYCNAQLLAPLISPELCQKQMGIYHGDAAVLLRTELAGIFMMNNPEDKNSVVRKANELASTALSTLLAQHTEPIYTVTFEGF